MLRRKGFTLVEIMIVVAIIGLLAVIAIPNFVRARTQAKMQACIENLKLIEGAKQVWALNTKTASTDTPDWTDLVPTYIKRQPTCPGSGVYTMGDVDTAPTCTVASHVLQ